MRPLVLVGRVLLLELISLVSRAALDFVGIVVDRCPELRSLTLVGATGVCERALLHLVERCVHLEELNIRHCGLSWKVLAALRGKKPSLNVYS